VITWYWYITCKTTWIRERQWHRPVLELS